MTPPIFSRKGGFTIGELMIGVSLSIMVMGAVLSSYVFVARAYTRTIGFGWPNQPTLEGQGRITLARLAQDVQMASTISSPSASEITLAIPYSLGGTRNVTYYYNSASTSTTIYSVTVPAKSLSRIDRTNNTATTLHTSLLTCVFTYYDVTGRPYTSYTDYLIGIKQLSLAFTAQAGTSANGTLTQIYRTASPKLEFRNKTYLY